MIYKTLHAAEELLGEVGFNLEEILLKASVSKETR